MLLSLQDIGVSFSGNTILDHISGDVQEAANQIGEMIRAVDKPYQDNNTAVILEYLG